MVPLRSNKEKILIAGGGLGGLSAAIALHRTGFDVAVFEQSPQLREIGAGFSVWPNATRVLKDFGILDRVIQRGDVIERLRVQTWRGHVLGEIRAVSAYQTPSICIHRADLLRALTESVPWECIHLGHKLEAFEQFPDRVVARFSNGQSAEGDALIGADGIHSAVRGQLLDASKPVYRGYLAWRGIARCSPSTHPRTTAVETWGNGKRFGMESMGGGRTFWYATVNGPQEALGNADTWKNEAREAFRGWCAPIPEVIEATATEDLVKNLIFDRWPVRRWGDGRVTLLGDSAHPTTPNLGQGACLAIEGAAVLARCLSETGCEMSARLRRYEKRRFSRTAFMTREALWLGRVGQWQNAAAVALGTAFLKLSPQFLMDLRHRAYFSFEA